MIPVARKESTNPATSGTTVSSLKEFRGKYSVDIKDGVISVVERTTHLVLTKLTTKKEDQLYDAADESHFHNGMFYFVLSSKRYATAKHVYSYDTVENSIQCILACPRNVRFAKNVLVNFGIGFTVPGPQQRMVDGRGVISVYDLNRAQGLREMQKITVVGGSGHGWDGDIDINKNEITAFDHVTGNKKTYTLFEKA